MRGRGVFGLAVLLVSLAANAQTVPDTSGWECSLCPSPVGLYVDFDAGLGYVTDDAYRFGDYTGHDEKGVVLLADIDLDFWSSNAGHWEVTGRDLGLDSRSVALQGGIQGLYSVSVSYDELPRRLFDTTRTPFSGSSVLRLPSGWVAASSTGAMALSQLSPVEIGHDRETLGLGLSFTPSSRFRYDIDYRHEDRSGTRIHSGSFITLSALLPAPVDYATDQIDATLSYVGARSQARIGYSASLFNSKPRALVWDNPYTPLAAGATRGRSSLPPDNQAHQFSLSGAVRIADEARVSGTVTFGELQQDDLFLPATINAAIVSAPVPQTSLNAKVETSRTNLRLDTRPLKKLRLRAEYDSDERDNKTARNEYEIVESDLFIPGSRTNVPYSYKRTRVGVKGDYRVDRKLTVSGGYRFRETERDFQEVRETDEETTWFSARMRQDSKFSAASVKFGHDERDGNKYIMPTDPVTAQNPLLRKFNLADRDRDFVLASVSLTPSDRIDLGLSVELSDEDYESTVLGLLGSESRRANLDAALRLSDKASLTLFYGRETIDSVQSGSSGFGVLDWSADIEDEIDTFTAALRLPQLRDNVDLVLDYTFSDSTGRIALNRAAGSTQRFPDLSARMHGARLYADFRPNERYTVRVGYYYESFKTHDWTLDTIAPDTLPTLLSLGAHSPNYNAGVFALSFQYSLAPDKAAP